MSDLDDLTDIEIDNPLSRRASLGTMADISQDFVLGFAYAERRIEHDGGRVRSDGAGVAHWIGWSPSANAFRLFATASAATAGV